MKSHILYAPVLLLSLSTACGKTDQKSKVSADEVPTALRADPALAEAETTAEPRAILTTGNVGVDTICAKPFKAYATQTQEEWDAVNLTSQTNETCFNLLLSTASTMITDLSALGYEVQMSATSYLDAALWKQFVAGENYPNAAYFSEAVFTPDLARYEFTVAPEANEQLEYLQLTVDELMAAGVTTLPQFQALVGAQSALDVQLEAVDKTSKIVAKLKQIIKIADATLAVGDNRQYIGSAAVTPAETPPAVNTPTGETPTATGTTSPDPATPTNGGEVGGGAVPNTPEPEPLPDPAPVPNPEPAPEPSTP